MYHSKCFLGRKLGSKFIFHANIISLTSVCYSGPIPTEFCFPTRVRTFKKLYDKFFGKLNQILGFGKLGLHLTGMPCIFVVFFPFVPFFVFLSRYFLKLSVLESGFGLVL